MPYNVTGCDSTGERHDYVMDDTGAVLSASPGSDVLSAWLSDNPYVKPEPVPGEAVPEPGALTPSQMDALRQHVSKLLTVVQIAPVPPEEAPVLDSQQGEHGRDAAPPRPASPAPVPHHTHAELEAMNMGELRDLARAAGVVGAASMSKAELVAALQAPHRSGSER